MFSKSYYTLVAGFREYALDAETKGFSLEDILEEIIIDIKEYNHIGTAYVTTAITRTDKEKKDIEERLLATTEYEKIECSYTVDEALIGGMVIRMGDKVVDSSIRTKLGKLERELMAIQL